MTRQSLARVIIAGTNSGCGKTTVTCALLSAFKQTNTVVTSFKCGPDYIDPMFHGKVLGISSSNLDPFFYDDNTLKALLCENANGICVIEGVMGFYDGMTLESTKASTYDVAKILNTPVILTVNCKGTAYSVLPVIEGFLNHKKDYDLAGVILNGISPMTYGKVKSLIEKHFENKIKVFGYLPKLPENLILESRHLGLVTANEITDIRLKLDELGKIALKTLDINLIAQTAKETKALQYNDLDIKPICENVNIAVAMDNAFCFYYKDNLKLIQKLGAKLCYFSPLKDEKLPENIDGIYLGGGYPELYLNELEKNVSMKNDIHKFLTQNKPCIAECGGFMYLTKEVEGKKMVGFFDYTCKNTGKLSRFGYQTLTALQNNLICKKNEQVKAHEFHYYDCSDNGNQMTSTKPSGINWLSAHTSQSLYAGFPHLSFYSNIQIPKNFIEKCKEFKHEQHETNGN
ncbi:MAG: cobyrinate a,c-diamide synthase [Clostridia bacterium]